MPLVIATTTSPLVVSTKQLSDQNTSGTLMGASPTDLIGFYGITTGVPRRAAGNNTALTTTPTTTAVAAIVVEMQATLVGLGLMAPT